ncbi:MULTISPECIES: aminoglycoside phosphotransferase family protein [Brachybacterium]|uniref:Aminoglycoside phosphotransferase family protein n=2 Tax=Brachybacterium TaxID=43668 RepID=A0A426SM64_9MICO|nr:MULTISPECIES: aminoglycoside phosphotransferase family protein [Brachybacterium]RRR19276.1 aminoglycoside phosphotransferase family protein [Brachybacterium paraconglomeratum]
MDITPLDEPRVPNALALLTDLGLPAEEAVVLHASNTLTLRLRPADVVARIAPRDRAGDLAVELERAEALQAVGAPVGPPDPRLAPTVHLRGEHAITLWEHLPARDREEMPPAEFADSLAALHTGMRALDLPVPPLADRVGHALDLLRDPERTPALAAAARSLLQETLARLAERAATGGPQQILHGEPHPGNVLDTPSGPRFIDLETFCRGPVEFDLAHAPAEVAAHYPGHDPALLEDCRTLSLAIATTWRFDRQDTFPDGRAIGEAWLTEVRARVEE